jgi:hypothetical protein
MKKHINPRNSKGRHHGYQEYCVKNKSWFRGNMKNGEEIGYIESNSINIFSVIGEEGTKVKFYIR